jgi:hypothetical protein
MKLEDFDTEEEREAYRDKRRGQQYTSERQLDGANAWLQRRWIKRIRVAVVEAKPHLYDA